MSIDIEAAPQKTHDVNLVGKAYKVKSPKTAVLMATQENIEKDDKEQSLNSFMPILELLFSKTEAKSVMKRLTDPKDQLDISHVNQLIEAIVQESQENPTTS